MTVLVRARFAVGAVAVVAAGMVAVAPQPVSTPTARVEVAAIQLQAAVATQAGAILDTVESQEIAKPAAASATASATAGQKLFSAGMVAITILATPLWYLAFPLTLTVPVVVLALLIGTYSSGPYPFGVQDVQPDPVGGAASGALLGLVTYFAGPFLALQSLIQTLVSPPTAYARTAAAVSETETLPAPRPRRHAAPVRTAPARAAASAAAVAAVAPGGDGSIGTDTAGSHPASGAQGRAAKARAAADHLPRRERGPRN